MNKSQCYKYRIWAWTYINGDYHEWNKIIYRKNKLTDQKKEVLSGNFADKLAWKHNCNIGLYGCTEVVSNE